METILKAKNLTKRFGGLTAVNQLNLNVNKGEILAVLGDNGAGKSTLIKMISGVYKADEGSIEVEGKICKIDNPRDALNLGIQTIYQDLALAENLNVYANIFLGREKLKKKFNCINVLDHKTMRIESEKVLKKLDIEIPSLEVKISNLSGGQRQSVAIARSIYWNAKILIMDEPTAALAVAEQAKVLDLARSLKDLGVGVIIISHQMRDVFAISDRIIVMRRGEQVAEKFTNQTTPDEIVGYIVGSETVTN